MYNPNLENKLIAPDIADLMTDYVSLQLDIDNTKVKAAAYVAQTIDIKRCIGQAAIDRVILAPGCFEDELEEEDLALRNLIIPALCWFTYSRLLLLFQGTYTDSGLWTEAGAEARNAAKSVAKEAKGVAETFMLEVKDFLDAENPCATEGCELTPRVRVVGGKERRASN